MKYFKSGLCLLMLFVALVATEENATATPTGSTTIAPSENEESETKLPEIFLMEASESGSDEIEKPEVKEIVLDETNRTTRSIGNIARLLLGGNVPPDHPLVKYPDPIQSSGSNSHSVIAAVPGLNMAQSAAPAAPFQQQQLPYQQQQQPVPLQHQQPITSDTFSIPSFLLPNSLSNNYHHSVPPPPPPHNGMNFQQPQSAPFQQSNNFPPEPYQQQQQQQYQAPSTGPGYQAPPSGFNPAGNSYNPQANTFGAPTDHSQTGGNSYYAPPPQPNGQTSVPPPGHPNGGNTYQTNGASHSSGSGVQYNSQYPVPSYSSPQAQQQPYENFGTPHQTSSNSYSQPPQNWQNSPGGQDNSYYSSSNSHINQPPPPNYNSQATYIPPQTTNNYQAPPPPSTQQYQPPPNNAYNNAPPNNNYASYQPQYQNPNPTPMPHNYNNAQMPPSSNSYASAPGPPYPNNNNYNAPQSNNYNAPQPNNYNAPPPNNYNAPQSNNYNSPPPNSYNPPPPQNSNYQPPPNNYAAPGPASQSPIAYQPQTNTYNNHYQSQPPQAYNQPPSQYQPQSPPTYNTYSPPNNDNTYNNYQAPPSNNNIPPPSYNSQTSQSPPSVPQNYKTGYNGPKKIPKQSGKNYPKQNNLNISKPYPTKSYNASPKLAEGRGRPKGEYDSLKYSNNRKEYRGSYNKKHDTSYQPSKIQDSYSVPPSNHNSPLDAASSLRGGRSRNYQGPPITFKVPAKTTSITYHRYPQNSAPKFSGKSVKVYASKSTKQQQQVRNSSPRSQSRSSTLLSSAESAQIKRLNHIMGKSTPITSAKVILPPLTPFGLATQYSTASPLVQHLPNPNPNFRELQAGRREFIQPSPLLPPTSPIIKNQGPIRNAQIVPSITIYESSYI